MKYRIWYFLRCTFQILLCRSSRQEVFCKKGVLRNFSKLIGSTCATASFSIRLSFIKKETLAQLFSCEFLEIFKNIFFIEHLWWLLLTTFFCKFEQLTQFFKIIGKIISHISFLSCISNIDYIWKIQAFAEFLSHFMIHLSLSFILPKQSTIKIILIVQEMDNEIQLKFQWQKMVFYSNYEQNYEQNIVYISHSIQDQFLGPGRNLLITSSIARLTCCCCCIRTSKSWCPWASCTLLFCILYFVATQF